MPRTRLAPVVLLALVLAFATTLAGTLAACADPAPPAPRLVVLLPVDQLRPDLLERYRPFFRGGLARILDRGRSFPNAVHDHGVTETAPGYASLATGTHPSRHGLVGNDWFELVDGRAVERLAVGDPDAPILGVPRAGGRSPRKLERTGLADWLLQAHPGARILSLSTKDRSAIILGGRSPSAHAYWFLASEARFVTSTWYRRRDPGWVEAFNRGELPALLDSVWTQEAPPEARAASRPDTAAYEWSQGRSHFPHRFLDESPGATTPDFGAWVRETPFLDRAVLALARRGVRRLELGAGDVPDLLALGLSSTDVVGHRWGPLSREQLDNLIRLDRELGRFLEFLDKEVGRGRWVLALSADHGIMTAPEQARELGRPGLRVPRELEDSVLARAEEAWAGARDPEEGARRVAAVLGELPFVAAVHTEEQLRARTEPGDSFLRLDRRSYYPGRVARDLGRYRVLARLTPGTMWWDPDDAAHHGSPYLYDRRVPLVFLAAGVEPGTDARPARTVDVAPTLALLAGIPFPEDLDGRPLLAVPVEARR